MGFFKRQLSNVIEWQEFRDDMIFISGTTMKSKKEAA